MNCVSLLGCYLHICVAINRLVIESSDSKGTKKQRNNTIHYLPQEIRETRLTEVTYLPITREMLEQLFSNSAKKDKHKLVKKRRA